MSQAIAPVPCGEVVLGRFRGTEDPFMLPFAAFQRGAAFRGNSCARNTNAEPQRNASHSSTKPGSRGADHETVACSQGRFWLSSCQRSKVNRETDTLGRVTWRAEYEPLGNIYAIREGEGRYQPLRLPGQIADIGGPEPDVYYNVHRYYRAKWGRYTQPDPLLNPAFAETLLPQIMGDDAPTPDYGSYAWYTYASDNPVNRADPLGLKDYGHCTPTGDVLKDTRYGGEVIMHGVTHSKYIVVRRWCFFRCYCDQPDNCYKIPCLNFFCEKDHGTSIKLNLFDKEGVRPCASHLAAARKRGKC